MIKENPYQNIEIEIIEKLEIARQSRVSEDIFPSTKSLEEIGKELEETGGKLKTAIVLEEVKELLKKLPQNYHSLPELTQTYNELYKKLI